MHIVCKHYINNRCSKENCRFKHIDNICKKYFFDKCIDPNCRKIHKYTLNNSNVSHNKSKFKPKNTESFSPNLSEPDLRVLINKPISNSNEITIIKNVNWKYNVIDLIKEEVNNNVYKLWHGDIHHIADDSISWKQCSPTFDYIIEVLCSYFSLTHSATRLNFYNDTTDWKPYHHDTAALKPEKAKTQNITVGASFGFTREISFQHAKSYNRKIK